ncbi:MAG: hypothetical protein IKN43_05235 [Selenomonadaceae bacterium]|nr:hypothetical protein [Selenomonadaceae bacterium]
MYQAKVKNVAGLQSVEIPPEYRLADEEILISRIGDTVLLMPKNSRWANMIDSVDMFTDDFMENGRE